MKQDRDIVTIEGQEEVICALSNSNISNDLDKLLIRFSRSRYFLKSNISKTLRDNISIEH